MTNPTWNNRRRLGFTVAKDASLSDGLKVWGVPVALVFLALEAATVRAIFSHCATVGGTYSPVMGNDGVRLSLVVDPALANQTVRVSDFSDLMVCKGDYMKVQLTDAAFSEITQDTAIRTFEAHCESL